MLFENLPLLDDTFYNFVVYQPLDNYQTFSAQN